MVKINFTVKVEYVSRVSTEITCHAKGTEFSTWTGYVINTLKGMLLNHLGTKFLFANNSGKANVPDRGHSVVSGSKIIYLHLLPY